MMNNDMLANIEYLREKADVSYEEAEQLLAQHDGNVMRVLVELERQGRVYSQQHAQEAPKAGEKAKSWQQDVSDCDAMKKTQSFMQKAFNTRLVVEKKPGEGKDGVVANLPVPYALVATVVAPWLAVGTFAVAIASGHNIKLEKVKGNEEGEA